MLEDDACYEWENNNPVRVKWTHRDLQDGYTYNGTHFYTYRTEKNNMNIYPLTDSSIFGSSSVSDTDIIAYMFGFFGKFPTNLTEKGDGDDTSCDYVFNDDGSIAQAMTNIGGNDYWIEKYWY